MIGAEIFYPDGELLVDGDTLVAVGPRGVLEDYIGSRPDWQPERVLDLKNHVVMPGLVNAHTHAAMTLLRGYADDMPLMPWLETKVWPFEALMEPDDMYWGTMLALCEMVRGGTTTMADMYMNEDRVADAVLEAGTRAVLCRGITAFDSANAERGLRENLELFHRCQGAGEGRVSVFLGPHAPYTCTGEFLREVRQEAERVGAGLHIHLAETLTEERTIRERTGLRPAVWLEELGFFGFRESEGSGAAGASGVSGVSGVSDVSGVPVLAAHCVHLNEEELLMLRNYGVRIAHNPESNMKLNSGTAPVARMLELGLCVGLGTDGASSNNDLDMFGEMRSASLQQKLVKSPSALKAYEVLRMATAGGGEALGLTRCGRLEPGGLADLIAVDFAGSHLTPCFSEVSHLVNCARGSDVRFVMVNGRVLMEQGALTGLDEEKICFEAARRAHGIAGRL